MPVPLGRSMPPPGPGPRTTSPAATGSFDLREAGAAARPRAASLEIRAHNLQGVDVHIPLSLLVAVTGVSGSGKSTLVEEVLYRTWLRRRGLPTEAPGACGEIRGLEQVDEVIFMDQQPSARRRGANLPHLFRGAHPHSGALRQDPSCPGPWVRPRPLLFQHPGRPLRRPVAGRASKRWRCSFLPTFTSSVRCARVGAFEMRFLEVPYRGHSIGDVLGLTLNEAMALFADQPRVVSACFPFGTWALITCASANPLIPSRVGRANGLSWLAR